VAHHALVADVQRGVTVFTLAHRHPPLDQARVCRIGPVAVARSRAHRLVPAVIEFRGHHDHVAEIDQRGLLRVRSPGLIGVLIRVEHRFAQGNGGIAALLRTLTVMAGNALADRGKTLESSVVVIAVAIRAAWACAVLRQMGFVVKGYRFFWMIRHHIIACFLGDNEGKIKSDDHGNPYKQYCPFHQASPFLC
jgi:hypothetical protein